MEDDVKIPQFDIDRIDALVAQYRHSLENLYRIAWLQGSIDTTNAARKELKNVKTS